MRKLSIFLTTSMLAVSALVVAGCGGGGTKITPKEFDASKLQPIDAGVGGGSAPSGAPAAKGNSAPVGKEEM